MSVSKAICLVRRDACTCDWGALLSVALALAAAGCGENTPSTPDGQPVPADASGGTRITVTTAGAPLLAAYSDADGSWLPATKLADNQYEFYVQGPYRVTVVCSYGLMLVHQLGRTLDDAHDLSPWCPPPDAFQLRGSVKASEPFTAFTLAVGNTTREIAGSTFDVAVPTGMHDVMAVVQDRVAVRRGIAVTADTTLTNPIDLASEGFALVPVTASVTNAAPDEPIVTFVTLETASGGGAVQVRNAADTGIVPNAALQPGDRQALLVATRGRGVRRTFREGTSTAFTLPAAIGPVTFAESGGTFAATWSTLGAYDLLRFEVSGRQSGAPTQGVVHDFEVSASYVQAAALTRLEHDLDVPGLQPAWRVDPTQDYRASLQAEHTTGDDTTLSSQAFENIVSAAPVADEPFALQGSRAALREVVR